MFRFRLEGVLRIRRRLEEAASIELAGAVAAARGQERLLEGLEAERQSHRQALAELSRGGLLARDLLLHRDYERGLGRRLEREGARLKELEAACEERRLALLERSRAKKVLERLKERQEHEARLSQARAEQKELDDLSGHRFGRREEGL
jgi:flagellar FliJ protein